MERNFFAEPGADLGDCHMNFHQRQIVPQIIMPKHLVILVAGILTRLTAPNWADRLGAHLHDVCRGTVSLQVEKKEYPAGPFPAWNLYWRNPRVAKALAEEIRMYGPGWVIDFIAHSNGADVAKRAASLLIASGVPVRSLILIASCTQSDVQRSGLMPLLHSGMLSQAIAYSSRRDGVLRVARVSTYGDLGVRGWTFRGFPFVSLKFRTRRFDKLGHCEYFADPHCATTFARIREDLGFGPANGKAAA